MAKDTWNSQDNFVNFTRNQSERREYFQKEELRNMSTNLNQLWVHKRAAVTAK